MPLTRQAVVDAAVVLADRDGVGALSMRRLAQDLGVEAMSLYHHVRNKSDLLDGLVDAVFASIAVPPAALGWREAMRQRALSARAVLRAHPWATPLLESRTSPGPATLRHRDAVLGVLRSCGFSVPLAASAYSLLDAYVYGFVLQETSLPFESTPELVEVADSMLAPFPDGAYPHLAEMVTEHALSPGYSYAAEFEIGLDLILDALARRLP